ncbi:dTMP kinase [Planctomycetota bacterium]
MAPARPGTNRTDPSSGPERAGGGVFFVLEGPDGAGKSTQIHRLREALSERGHDVLLVREPGGTDVGERVRSILLNPGSDDGPAHPAGPAESRADPPVARALTPRTELFLFLASRAQLVSEVIGPALAAGRIVLADRFFASTAVYQGYASGALEAERILELCLYATSGLTPDMTIVLLVGADTSQTRVSRDGGLDRIEQRPTTYFERVTEGYRQYADGAPEPVVPIDGERPEDAVFADVLVAVLGVIEERQRPADSRTAAC